MCSGRGRIVPFCPCDAVIVVVVYALSAMVSVGRVSAVEGGSIASTPTDSPSPRRVEKKGGEGCTLPVCCELCWHKKKEICRHIFVPTVPVYALLLLLLSAPYTSAMVSEKGKFSGRGRIVPSRLLQKKTNKKVRLHLCPLSLSMRRRCCCRVPRTHSRRRHP